MAIFKNSRILWTIPLVIAICLFSFPAYAKYAGGTGEPNDPYQIATAADLIALGETPEDYDKHFILTADINLDPNLPDRKVFDRAVIAPDTDPKYGFQGAVFSGVFDGNGHEIVGFRCSSPEDYSPGDYMGLFGCVRGRNAEVKNIVLSGPTVKAWSEGSCLGALAGYLEAGAVTSCCVEGGIVQSGIFGKGGPIGGLIGVNQGAVTHCHSTSHIKGGEAGGLVGSSTGAVIHCYAAAVVEGDSMAGGLIGCNDGGVIDCYSARTVHADGPGSVGGLIAVNHGTVTNCYSTGLVSGTRDDWYNGGLGIGGLIGYNDGAITNCYSTAAVNGETGEFSIFGQSIGIGGLVADNGGLISCCYSTGQVAATVTESSQIVVLVGGLVAVNDSTAESNGIVAESFWDVQTSGQITSAGGTGRTTAEMNDMQMYHDAGWDFVGQTEDGVLEAWQMPEGSGCPVLAVFGGYDPPQLQGKGTADEPYLISNAFELVAIRHHDPSAQYRLAVPIDLSNIQLDMPLIPWFGGTFDGNNLTISHLTIKGRGYLGTFGRLGFGAEVRYLGVVDANITGEGCLIGGLAGYSEGVIDDSYTTGVISGSTAVGGLVGHNDMLGVAIQSYSISSVDGMSGIGGLIGDNWGTLIQCQSNGSVSCTGENAGGLVGKNDGIVIHCCSTGPVSGTGENCGGLVGLNSGGSLTQCYSTGSVHRWSPTCGGLVGQALGNATDTLCFWDIQTSGWTASAGGIGKGTAEMQDIQTYLDAGWDFVVEIENGLNDIWHMPQEGGYPVLAIFSEYVVPQLQGLGTPTAPYLISDPLELGAMIQYSPYAHYRLVAPVDLSGVTWSVAVIPWFAGTFDGNNLEISNLTIQGDNNLGLFGRLESGAIVKHLGVVDVNVAGSGYSVAGLVGLNEGTLSHCYSTGSVSGMSEVGGVVGRNNGALTDCHSTCQIHGISEVGGLVGFNYLGDVTQCHSTSVVEGTYNVGGLTGLNYIYATLTDCHSSGVVDGVSYVGGLVGGNASGVENCFSTAAVSGNGWSIGGLVGDGGVVRNSWSTGDVTSDGDDVGGLVGARCAVYCSYSTSSVCGGDNVGGLVGSAGTVEYSFSRGTVKGKSKVGGLIGYNIKDYYYVYNSYSQSDVNGITSVGGLVGRSDRGMVFRCYNSGSVTGNDFVGGLVGEGGGSGASFWDVETSGQPTNQRGDGKTTAEMQTDKTFLDARWDFVGETANGTKDIWWIDEGKDYPRLWWELVEE